MTTEERIQKEAEAYGKGNEITEEVWRGIVDPFMYPMDNEVSGYENYIDHDLTFNTATESGHSWIKSEGMKPETTLILKLKNNA